MYLNTNKYAIAQNNIQISNLTQTNRIQYICEVKH